MTEKLPTQLVLEINQVFQMKIDNKNINFRVVDIPDDSSLFIFNIDDIDHALPEICSVEKISQLHTQGLINFDVKDPFWWIGLPEDQFTQSQIKTRDSRWLIFAKFLDKGKSAIFDDDARPVAISELHQETGVSVKQVYYLIKLWLRGGQTKNALFGNYQNCGHPIKGERKYSPDKKVGRRSEESKRTGIPDGVNLTPEDKKIFSTGTKNFYLGQGNRHKDKKDAYNEIMRKIYRVATTKEGEIILPLPSDVPRYEQYLRWFKNEYENFQIIQSREGDNYFDTTLRPLFNNGLLKALKPGRIIQIDAFIGKNYLRSSIYGREKIVGRPVGYFARDVATNMIAGMATSLEGPSWESGKLAIANIMEDKVKFCKSFGIEITQDMWPSHHKPDFVLADNGEFKAILSDFLVNTMGIQIINVPAYRPDYKGLIERFNLTAVDEIIKFLPGFVYPMRRTDKDYRLDGCLTLYEFTQILIDFVIAYNNYFVQTNFRKDEFMMFDEVPRIPISLWNWGISNLGRPSIVPFGQVVTNLYPHKPASITRSGLEFEGAYYTSEFARRNNWFEKAAVDGTKQIEVNYHPYRDDNKLHYLNGTELVEFELMPQSSQFSGRNLCERQDYLATEKHVEIHLKHLQDQAMANVLTRTEETVKQAEALTQAAQDGMSNAALVKGIGDNRHEEKEARRHNAENNTALPTNDEMKGYIGEASNLDALLKQFTED